MPVTEGAVCLLHGPVKRGDITYAWQNPMSEIVMRIRSRSGDRWLDPACLTMRGTDEAGLCRYSRRGRLSACYAPNPRWAKRVGVTGSLL